MFGYGARYLKRPNPVPVDPVALRLSSMAGDQTLYESRGGHPLFGAVRDAAPDFWRRRVIESSLKVPPNSLPESAYLLNAGSHRFGALDFRDNRDDGESAGALPPIAELGYVHKDRTELYARVAFNILVSNNDDHLRNHAFVWAHQGKAWRLSPLYDVVPHPQVAQERRSHLSLGPQGRTATLTNLLEAQGEFGLLKPEAAKVIDRVAGRVREWRNTFESWDVPKAQSDLVEAAFRKLRDVGALEVEMLYAKLSVGSKTAAVFEATRIGLLPPGR